MAKNKLTIQQEAFYTAYLEVRDFIEAYKRSYNTDGMSKETIRREAHRLSKHPLIATRLEGFQQRAELQSDVKGLLTLEEHMNELKLLRDMAKVNGQISAAVGAEVKRGELRRFYVKQVEVGEAGEFAQMPEDDLDRFIRQEAEQILEAQRPSRLVKSSSARH